VFEEINRKIAPTHSVILSMRVRVSLLTWTSPTLSVSGNKYYLLILDDYSHYLWTFPLCLKSDTFLTLSHFFAWVSTWFGRTVLAVQCDNSTSHSFFLSHDSQVRMSCPYHYQNPALCRVLDALLSAFCRALGKAYFAKCHSRRNKTLGNDLVY
jgi:hypothetical protein